MELLLAVIVCASIIFFGALISIGNARQSRAIDNLREQTTLWAIHDLQIKREKLSKEIQIENPLNWFGRMASKIIGGEMQFQYSEVFDEPQALVCDTGDNLHRFVFTPVRPGDVRRFGHRHHGRLSQDVSRNPLRSLPRGASVYELSVLNGGIFFDFELRAAWRNLTGQELEPLERLWIYKIPWKK